ncbi:hypothetical protein KSD_65580 [Ktedonobacter sp. SOSP1-85]|uniref:hypothetical protein n=1 Tax=Ktedonobacter sp. SOSP1-85 TaxID=2778367 RepID=UPI0019165388|nr:hypothetical protein [Ktedonobacter sp. SOSP1-85]GHO78787.1 hypothetical protein KSD_65580 [Ktedonobacter sp. SOSP1-85]
MLITRAPFDEELAQAPEEVTRSDVLFKRLDGLLDDEDLLDTSERTWHDAIG